MSNTTFLILVIFLKISFCECQNALISQLVAFDNVGRISVLCPSRFARNSFRFSAAKSQTAKNTIGYYHRSGHATTINEKSHNSLLLICGDDLDVLVQGHTPSSSHFRAKVLIAGGQDLAAKVLGMSYQPRLDSEVYILDIDTMCLSELYYIQDKRIFTSLLCNQSYESLIAFIMNNSVVARRSDFRGVTIKAITAREPPMTICPVDLADHYGHLAVSTQTGPISPVPCNELSGT